MTVVPSGLATQPIGEAAPVAEGVWQLKLPVPFPLRFVSVYLVAAQSAVGEDHGPLEPAAVHLRDHVLERVVGDVEVKGATHVAVGAVESLAAKRAVLAGNGVQLVNRLGCRISLPVRSVRLSKSQPFTI